MRRSRPRAGAPGDDRGAVAILVAVFMVLLMGLAAIVIDLGFARDRSRLAQSAADAAALAAAQYLSTTPAPTTPTPTEYDAARTRALDFVSANGWPAGGVVTFDAARFVVTVALNPQASPTFFAGALGASAPTVARSAAARWADPSVASGTCSVCVFGNLDTQNGDLFVANGDVRAAGRITTGPNGEVTLTGGGRVYAGDLAGSSGAISPAPLQQVGPVPDPFATVPVPPLGQPITSSPSGPCTQGTYADVENCTTFAPGVYVLTGATKWTGNQGATGDRVLFYLTCASGGRSAACASRPVGQRAGGSLSSNGGPKNVFSFTPHDDPQYRGLVVYGDRENTAVNDIQGGSEFSTGAGSFYMKSGTLDRGGNPVLRIGGVLAVGTMAANGNPNPAYVTGTPTTAPPPPPAAGVVVLVD